VIAERMLSRIAYPSLTVEQEDPEEASGHQSDQNILGPAAIVLDFAKASVQASGMAGFDIRGFGPRALPTRAIGA
jgi:hypothetical protein